MIIHYVILPNSEGTICDLLFADEALSVSVRLSELEKRNNVAHQLLAAAEREYNRYTVGAANCGEPIPVQCGALTLTLGDDSISIESADGGNGLLAISLTDFMLVLDEVLRECARIQHEKFLQSEEFLGKGQPKKAKEEEC